MSHELRTPLNAVIGYSELLLESLHENHDTTTIKDVGHIKTAGESLLSLINDVLDISKVEAGKVELHYEFVAIHSLINEVKATADPLAQKNNNTVEYIVDTTINTCVCDPIKVRQILLN
jgi:signal transduction histidine kinase